MSIWSYSKESAYKKKPKEKKLEVKEVCYPVEAPIKEFLFQNFKENILNEIKRRQQIHYIPRCSGLYCLNTKTRFGPRDRNYYVGRQWMVIPSVLERSTNKLTKLAVKKACSEDRQRRIEFYQQNSFPINPALVQVHLELKALVKAGKDKHLNQLIGIREHTEDQKALMHFQLNSLVNQRNIKKAVKASLDWHIERLQTILYQKAGAKFSKDIICTIKKKCLLHRELLEAVAYIRQKQIEQWVATVVLKDACVQTIRRGIYITIHGRLMKEERERRMNEISKLKRKEKDERKLRLQPIHEELLCLFSKVQKKNSKVSRRF